METLPNLPATPSNPQEINQPPDPSTQSQPVPPTTVEAPSPSEPQKPIWFNKWLIITIVVTVILFLLLLGWWLYQFSGRTQSSVQDAGNQTAPTDFSDIADDWRSYISQKCRYQISYPPAWSIYTEAEQEDLAAILIASSPIEDEAVTAKDVRIQIGCSLIDSALTPKTVVDDLNTRYQGKGFVLSSVQMTTISGKTAYFQTVSSPQTGTLKEYYIFPTSNRVTIVNIVPSNSHQIDTAELILNKIIFN